MLFTKKKKVQERKRHRFVGDEVIERFYRLFTMMNLLLLTYFVLFNFCLGIQ